MPPSDRIKPISYLTARHERRQEAAALLKMLELGERQIRAGKVQAARTVVARLRKRLRPD